MLTTQEIIDAIYAKAAMKAEASTTNLVPSGAPALMASQIEAPTSTVAKVRELRARNRQLFETDPAGAAVRFAGIDFSGLLKQMGL